MTESEVKGCLTLLIHTESKVSLEVLINTNAIFVRSGRDSRCISKASRSDCTLRAQLEYSYPYSTLIFSISPFIMQVEPHMVNKTGRVGNPSEKA